MTHSGHGSQAQIGPFGWPIESGVPGDVVDFLSDALGAAWVVERQSDYEGEVSIIVLPQSDPDDGPSFILFEEDGATALGRICMERWGDTRSFRTFREAVDALIADASAYAVCAWPEEAIEPAASGSYRGT